MRVLPQQRGNSNDGAYQKTESSHHAERDDAEQQRDPTEGGHGVAAEDARVDGAAQESGGVCIRGQRHGCQFVCGGTLVGKFAGREFGFTRVRLVGAYRFQRHTSWAVQPPMGRGRRQFCMFSHYAYLH